MSAAPVEHGQSASGLRLIPLIRSKGKLPSHPFVIFIIVLMGFGVAIVFGLATAVQNESAKLAELKVQANELRYREAALQSQVEEQSSGQYLSAKAWELGMRPNPYPAVMKLEDGSVTGTQQAVQGNEIPLAEPPKAPDHALLAPEGQDAKNAEAEEEKKAESIEKDKDKAAEGSGRSNAA